MPVVQHAIKPIAGFASSAGFWASALVGMLLVVYGNPMRHEAEPYAAIEPTPVGQVARDDYGAQIWSLAFSRDGSQLAAGTIIGDVWIKQMRTGQSSRITEAPLGRGRSIAFSTRGHALAFTDKQTMIRFWDTEERLDSDPLDIRDAEAKQVAFSPDGTTIAIGGTDGMLGLWDAHTRNRIATLRGHRVGINTIAFSTDGAQLVSGDKSGLIKTWALADRREQATLRAHRDESGQVMSIALTSDGALLATATSFESTVRFWDPATGSPRGFWNAGEPRVNSIAFSADGVLLAVALNDGTLCVLSVPLREVMASVRPSPRALEAVAFAPGGTALVTGGLDGSLRVWDLSRLLSAHPASTAPSRP